MEKPWIQRAKQYRRANKISRKKLEVIGRLSIKYKHAGEEEWTDLGVVSEAVVTAAAIAQFISVLQGGSATTLQTFKFHGSGTSTVAESQNNTALGAEVETREIGTQTSGGPGTYRSQATHLYLSDLAITEHGLFSTLTDGILFDRSKFLPILVSAGSSIVYTYDLLILGS